jgi:cyanophycinase
MAKIVINRELLEDDMENKVAGNLLIVGGNEDKQGDCQILRKFVAMAGGRKAQICIVTTATEYPREVGAQYRDLFARLGAEKTVMLHVAGRDTANDRRNAEEIERSSGIFFTGGDQLRFTSLLGGTHVDAAIRSVYAKGTVVAGTSAGASVMSDTMIVDGDSSDTATKSIVSMAHGMGLLEEVVIDQHFAQRGRINRLLAAVAQNPFVLGVGIDEDTALVVRADGHCEVVGSQTVTIVDGANIIHSNISESQSRDPLAITNVLLHILPVGMGFDLKRRLPYICKDEQEDKEED